MTEYTACKPIIPDPQKFNSQAKLPYGLTVDNIKSVLEEYVDFLSFINSQLHTRKIPRLESFLMPATFSGIVGEFMNFSIPKYCNSLVKNQYHNGHPDLIPINVFPQNAVQYSDRGIEVKASRYMSRWQGHNPEAIWLMVFCFDSNKLEDPGKDIKPKPFKFLAVYAAKLNRDDWNFSGRSKTSRRTSTATVNNKGLLKMKSNWIYEDISK
ncbi:hypothetical protein [Geitlerinema sp. PCC 9228]|jgi:hypothetical protein|uniref:hypothetical protein n=1 Tax=Geitlerinema sp. PCC 9228 TaxID=111611 RepID=UPI0008F9A72B|nr:hypothetical protein [Geitlerinema sp. PCC 9228]